MKVECNIVVEFDQNPDDQMDRKRTLTAEECVNIFRAISDADCFALGFEPPHSRPDFMIIRNLPVAPPCVRPYITLDNIQKSEDDLTY
jgi:DNA-directed RNA polymerase II subunit RPB1